MTRDGSQPEMAPELARLLGSLGQQPTEARVGEDEGARAERLATHLDQQLAKLVRRKRALRVGLPLALAASLVLAFGAWKLQRARAPSAAIEREPLGPSRPAAPAVSPIANTPEPRAAQPSEPTARRTSPQQRPAPPPASAVPAPSTEGPLSTLGRENRLFESAARAERDGKVELALQELDQLLGEYPKSPLAQGALVRKFRLLSAARRTEAAVSAAQRYLELYPTGFAVKEAAALAAGAPPPSTGERP